MFFEVHMPVHAKFLLPFNNPTRDMRIDDLTFVPKSG